MAKVYADLIRKGLKTIDQVPEKSGQKSRRFSMLRLLLFLLLRKEVDTMAVIYATLIVKGRKTFSQVPDKIKDQVRQVLIDLECEDLIVE